MSSLFCCFASSVIFSRLPSWVVQSNFFLKQFQTATQVLVSAKCSSQRLPLPTVQVSVAIHATDDDIILTDISSWGDLPPERNASRLSAPLGTCSPGGVNI